jgi:hypothetical protein
MFWLIARGVAFLRESGGRRAEISEIQVLTEFVVPLAFSGDFECYGDFSPLR